LAVVKADGYGHGLAACARATLEAGASHLGVSSIEEGIALRDQGVTAPVLLLGSLYPFDNFPVLFDYNLTPTVASQETAEALDRLARERGRRLPVHLKVDSGFGRIGVSLGRALDFIRQAQALPGLEIEGLYTHFASSDVDLPYTREQASAFRTVVRQAAEAGIRPPWIHLANSAALLRLPETHGTLVRPGISLYGIPPYAGAAQDIALKPVLAWKTRVIFLKQWPAGASVGYARTWEARRPSRIATLAVGYADGFPRLLTNRGAVLIRGLRAPVVGRVTMDMTMVDVTDLPACRVGDEAVLIGSQGAAHLSAQDLADGAETNAYEILCRIGPRVPRIYHG
jgi:alanine racemase